MFSAVRFYAETRTAHKGSPLVGTCVAVPREPTSAQMNGEFILAVRSPKGDLTALPSTTWLDPRHFARMREVSEVEARRLHPALFNALESHATDPEYRAAHAAVIAAALDAGYDSVKTADPEVMARMKTIYWGRLHEAQTDR